MHFPGLVQTLGLGEIFVSSGGGCRIFALGSLSLRFGNLLNPRMGFLERFSYNHASQG